MYSLIRICRYALNKALPYNDTSDRLLNYIKFIDDHDRLPKKRYYFNDYLFSIKNTDEILNPLRQFISDKYFVKDYVRSKLSEEYNVPTIAIFDNYEDLVKFDFPENCCIKPTHASQAVILRKNNEPIDLTQTKDWFDLNYYKVSRERNYKYLKPRVIVEPLIFDSKDLMDYRIFCYEGQVKLICVDIGKYSGYKRVFYDSNWIKQEFSLHYPLYEGYLEKPENLNEMLGIAEKLSTDFDFIRVDLYSDGKKCLVGEITNCHAAASQKFVPLSSEEKASKIIFGDK